jgi:hypothetical protein
MGKWEVIRLAAVAVAAFALGAYVIPEGGKSIAENAKPAEKAVRKKVRDGGRDAGAEALRARVRELESRLSSLQTAHEVQTGRVEAVAGTRGQGRGDPVDWLERIKKESPERYTRMTNRMARARAEHLDRTIGRLDTLASVDTSGWTAQAKKVHEEYQALIERREELMEKMNPQNSTSEERREAMTEMAGLFGRLRELGETERDNLLDATMKDFGLSGDDAKDMIESVKTVYEVTSEFRPGRRRGPGGRGQGR